MKGHDVKIHEDIYLSFTCLGVNEILEPYPIRAVVNDQYKLIHYLNHGIEPPRGSGVGKVPEWQLFDLQNDPGEVENLYEDAQYAEIREHLTKRLEFWTLEVGDKGMETEFEAVGMFPETIGHLKMPQK